MKEGLPCSRRDRSGLRVGRGAPDKFPLEGYKTYWTFFPAFGFGGITVSILRQEKTVHRHVIFRWVDSDKLQSSDLNNLVKIGPTTFLLSTASFHVPIINRRQCECRSLFENHIRMIWKLSTDEFFKYLGNNWPNIFWSIIILSVSRIIHKKRCFMLANLKVVGKFNAFMPEIPII